MASRCDRCRCETGVTIVSRFNTETICIPCENRERAHPAYAQAAQAELEAVQRGDYNFPGVGAPADLYRQENTSNG